MTRARLAHYGGPAALLLAVTVAVLLVRGALSSSAPPPPLRGATTAATPATPPPRTRPGPAVVYRVGAGDTLGAIAARYHTTVERLLKLNPGVEPTSLRVGQRLRVK